MSNNNIGDLFKEFSENSNIQYYITEGIKENQNILDIVGCIFDDNELIEFLTTFVSNVTTIKDKLKIFVGQQIKKMSSSNDKKEKKEEQQQNLKQNNEEDEDDTTQIMVEPYAPPLTDNPRWLFQGCYVEQIGLRMHMSTPDHEFYY
jgi:hypothetical protein